MKVVEGGCIGGLAYVVLANAIYNDNLQWWGLKVAPYGGGSQRGRAPLPPV